MLDKEYDLVDPAGCLEAEMDEIMKLNVDSEIVPYGSWTRACMAFLSLVCC